MSNSRVRKANIRTLVQEPSGNETIQRASVRKDETDKKEVPQSLPPKQSPDSQPKRTKIGYGLRDDLIKDFKQIALDEDKKIYEVMELALEDYLKAYAKNHAQFRMKSRITDNEKARKEEI